MELTIGMSKTIKIMVDETNTASRRSPSLPQVLSTPDMISAMEAASWQCILPALPEGKRSVGTHVNVSHDMGVPIGTEVTVTSTIIEIDRRRIVFEVLATCDKGQVGAGTHTRFVVDADAPKKQ